MKMELRRFKCDTLFQNHLVALGGRKDGVFLGVILYFVSPDGGRNFVQTPKQTFNYLLPERGSIPAEATGGLSEHHRPIFTRRSEILNSF